MMAEGHTNNTYEKFKNGQQIEHYAEVGEVDERRGVCIRMSK